ncbi:MAG: ABC transporter permease [Bacteroidia bacterium]
MITHYIKIAIRNLTRQKGLTLINILGLSIGLACFTLFMLYALNEFNYDRFHKNADNIFRAYRWRQPMNGEDASGDSFMPMPLGPAMKQDLPGVVNFIRMQESWGKSFIKTENNVMRIGVAYADPEFFDVFSFHLLYGNPAQALRGTHSVVLTKATAIKIFGNENAVGKTLQIKTDTEFESFTVNGVCENIPSNSSIKFEILGNYLFLTETESGKRLMNNWHRSAYQTYIQLQPGSSLAYDETTLQNLYNKYHSDDLAEMKKKGKLKGNESPVTYKLQPLRDIHTNTKINGEVDPKNIWILLTIAAGVLLIACINFTTLAIGRSAGRAKEVGIRKVVGGGKKSLVLQFLTEAILLSIISMLIGLLLAQLFLPWFNQLSSSEIAFSFTQFPELTWVLIALTLIVGVIAGSYPAFVLSAFKPIEVLKSKLRLGGSNFFTKSLVTLQFMLSVGLIISTFIILQQLNFMRSKNPGFNKENVIVVDASGMNTKKIYPLFSHALQSHPEVKGVASAELGLGGETGWSSSSFDYKGRHKNVYEYFIDPDYLHVMDIKLLAGRNFDHSISDDTVHSVIVNEAMVRDFGWTLQNAVGQQLTGYGENFNPVVIGVIKDFHFRPFSEKVEPQMFQQFSGYLSFKYFVRIQPGEPSKSITILQNEWQKIAPEFPFKYSFLDQDLDRFYKSEARWAAIVGCAGGISIFLACLGLLGLAALAVINRTKEIGIRKVLGASVTNIVKILSIDFVRLVIIALIIATPVSWYFMNQWLQDFAYRINISWWIFVISGLIAITISVLTVSIHTVKAAVANPVKSLRTE